MKRTLAIICALSALAVSCNKSDNDNDGVINFTRPTWATVKVEGETFSLDSDFLGNISLTNTDFNGYVPEEGQRVIASFSNLEDCDDYYDYTANLVSIRNILTKDVEILAEPADTDFGSDSLLIYKGDMTISEDHLNVRFSQKQPVNGTKHLITLTHTPDEVDEDGYLVLELRYNDYDDISARRKDAIVSFDLSPLGLSDDTKGIVVKMCSEVNGEVSVAFRKKDSSQEEPSPDWDLSDIPLQ